MARPAHDARSRTGPWLETPGSSGGGDGLRLVPSPICQIFIRRICQIWPGVDIAKRRCRATLETLAVIKSPPSVFAKQANMANGPQQVNNVTRVGTLEGET